MVRNQYKNSPMIVKMIKDSLAADYKFFDEDTMRFWNTKFVSPLYDNNVFVTSEDNFDRTEELFSIRRYDWEKHSVKTIEFQTYDNLEEAREYAKSLKFD